MIEMVVLYYMLIKISVTLYILDNNCGRYRLLCHFVGCQFSRLGMQ